MKRVIRLFFATLVCVSLVPLASASTACTDGGGFESDLNNISVSGVISSGTSYGDVCVNLDATQTIATITFTAASGYSFVDGNIANVNLNVASASDFTEAFVADTTTSSPTAHEFAASPVDGFGKFNLQWDNGAASDQESFFTFTVTNASGTWASAGDVLIANALGFDASAHVIGADCPLGATCFVAEGTAVPEPRFYGLLLTGLMALAGKTFFRRRAT
jgi:hypothetical protein